MLVNIGNTKGDLGVGIYLMDHWNPSLPPSANQYPEFPDSKVKTYEYGNIADEELNAYGVCDSPEQLLAAYDFASDVRKFCIAFVKLQRSEQYPEGGWRWHRWGPYIGAQSPQCEYLYDERNIDVVYTYHIYEIV